MTTSVVLRPDSKVLVCGSRDWPYPGTVASLIASLPKTCTVIHGGCPTGADRAAEEAARRRGQNIIVVRADWSLGKKAGPLRNREMLDLNPVLVAAFWYGFSAGTRDTVRETMKRGIPLKLEWRARELV